ncbi:DUF488 domain-containing protein [Planctomicrobium piriforme]|uniref:DUF488 domain-containing protein n=1 Tax=Planctomicrobium piriforme TaxID=1576369 RepID=A0A1I3BLA0_9PLAN|nr:DUF488 domain-containing protein [Planctomicrobium piriforme]SFH63094.1 Protein of unknown function, DUF488 [Planctomicrobium piriforme]
MRKLTASNDMDGRFKNVELFTIGHSNQPLEDFLDLLKQHQITALVDIRRFPGSRAFPQFNQETLSTALRDHGIEYHWFESLGGRRPASKSAGPSPNLGLKNPSFRNYADYMATGDFQTGIEALSKIAAAKKTAIMCSESVFWRCHRRLVSDFWTAQGGLIQHIFSSGEIKPHQMTEGAKINQGTVTYPGPKTLFD